MAKTTAIGIDLGTTYSCVAVWDYGKVEIIANDQGNLTTASYVAFTPNGRLIGDSAKMQVATNAENTVFDAKRLIGRRFEDPSLQEDLKHFPFTVLNVDGKPSIEITYKGEKKKLSPEEVSAMILGHMKETAEAYLGAKVTDAVITVPAYFNDSQRQATKDAGEIAGLKVLRIINEPTAAAIAYGLDKKCEGERNVLVFDLGGGTFDVSILTLDDGVIEVKSTSGDTHLGGEDFDNRLVSYLAQEFRRKHKQDISMDKRALRRLRSAAETAKRTLSTQTQAYIDISSLFGDTDFEASISRAKFEDLCSDLFQKTLEPVKNALSDAKLETVDIDEVILVGGSTRIPKIQRLLSQFFNGKDLNQSINPDEAVAYGAAVQAAILSGEECDLIQDLLLLDLTPLSLGVKIVGDRMSTIIPRNSTIPVKQTELYSTASDYQTSVKIVVYEGERAFVKDNNLLGKFDLEGITPRPEGETEIDVTFQIDVDGILNVSAVEKGTGKENQLTIVNEKGRLSKEHIEQMIRDAETYAEDDATAKEISLARWSLQQYVSQTKLTIEQATFKIKMSSYERESITSKLNQVEKWLENSLQAGESEFSQKLAECRNVCDPIIAKFY